MKINLFSTFVMSRYLRQFVAATVATLGSFACGAVIAWSSPAIPRINQDECLNHCDLTGIDMEKASWIGPLVPLGAIVCGPVAGSLVNRIGRRSTMMILTLPLLIGLVLIGSSLPLDNIYVLYVGRFIAGFSSCAFAFIAPMYANETSETAIKGMTASMGQMMATLGVGFVAALNIYSAVHWVIITGILAILPVVMFILLFFVPETPYYLVRKGRRDEAEAALRWLRGNRHEEISRELEALEKANLDQENIGSISFKTLLTDPQYRTPFAIANFLMFMQQFCGINVIIFYSQTIFQKAGSTLDPGLSAFLVALFQIFGTALAVVIVDKYGRKILLILSGIVMGITMFSTGAFFYLDERKEIVCQGEDDSTLCNPRDGFPVDLVSSLGWLPLISLIIYIFFFSLGIGPLCWTMNVELSYPESKAIANSSAFMFNWTCAFIVTKFEPVVEMYVGASGAYFSFGIICLLAAIKIIFIVPETKGKSNEEIRQLFAKKPRASSKQENLQLKTRMESKI